MVPALETRAAIIELLWELVISSMHNKFETDPSVFLFLRYHAHKVKLVK